MLSPLTVFSMAEKTFLSLSCSSISRSDADDANTVQTLFLLTGLLWILFAAILAIILKLSGKEPVPQIIALEPISLDIWSQCRSPDGISGSFVP